MAGNISWIIGEACSRMPMPAVTLQNNTTQSSQKDRVRMALAAVTLAVVRIPWCSVGAVQPSGAHPGAGTRAVNAPRVITTR